MSENGDYISREAANEACREAVRRYPNSFYNGIEAARDAIRKLPAADVRPVVLCRDCIYNKGIKTWIDHDTTADCMNGHGYPPLDWFCADGEKKEES